MSESDWETSDTPAPQTPPPHKTERGKPFGTRQSELKSWLCHLSGKWPGDSHLLFLSFSTLTCKTEVKVPWPLGCCGTKGASTWETQKIDHCSNVAAPTTGPLLASETNFTVTVEVCRVWGEGKKTSTPYCWQRVLNSLSPLLSLLSESSVCKNRKCIYVSYLPFSLHSSNAVLLLSSDWAKTPSICNIPHCTAPTTFTLDCQVILQNSALRHFTNKYPTKQF